MTRYLRGESIRSECTHRRQLDDPVAVLLRRDRDHSQPAAGWREVLEQGLVSARSAKRAFTLLLGVPTSKMDLIMVHHYKHETSKRLYSPRLGVRVHASLHPACTGAKRENSSSSVLISHLIGRSAFEFAFGSKSIRDAARSIPSPFTPQIHWVHRNSPF